MSNYEVSKVEGYRWVVDPVKLGDAWGMPSEIITYLGHDGRWMSRNEEIWAATMYDMSLTVKDQAGYDLYLGSLRASVKSLTDSVAFRFSRDTGANRKSTNAKVTAALALVGYFAIVDVKDFPEIGLMLLPTSIPTRWHTTTLLRKDGTPRSRKNKKGQQIPTNLLGFNSGEMNRQRFYELVDVTWTTITFDDFYSRVRVWWAREGETWKAMSVTKAQKAKKHEE